MLSERLVLKENRLMLASDALGDIPPGNSAGLGLYSHDTRFLSGFELRINGRTPVLLSRWIAENHVATFQMVNPELEAGPGLVIPPQSVSIRRTRFLGRGLHERIGLQNWRLNPVDIQLTARFAADFRDIFDVRAYFLQFLGSQVSLPPVLDRLRFGYQGLDGIERGTEIHFERPPDQLTDSEATWNFSLPVRGMVSMVINILPWIGAAQGHLEANRDFEEELSEINQSYRLWESGCSEVVTSRERFNAGLLRQGALDLRLLLDTYPEGQVPTAGLPWYSAPFGRDALITSLQTLMLRPDLAQGTLRYLAAHQGREVDTSREEEPGKILHELRSGELANLRQIPHTPYFGSVDATPLFLVLLAEYLRWTGDLGFAEEMFPAALRALEWVDNFGDIDGDGFVDYLPHTRIGVRNQGWKDSLDSLTLSDGSRAQPPAALVEVQGYVYQAKVGLAPICAALGRTELAERLMREAEALRQRFEAAFWLESEGFYAQALDGSKNQVTAVSSNPGHCLWSGICPPDHARRVAERLMQEDMFSGWGIRTLATSAVSYNPMSYHNGSVWPHDNSIIAAGLRRYGCDQAAERVISSVIDAGLRFADNRLPELFCGFARDHRFGSGPAEYLVSCVPQAWGAGAIFHFLQVICGVEPDTLNGSVGIQPLATDLFESITVRNMRIGGGSMSFRVNMREGDPAVELLEVPRGIEVGSSNARLAG